MKNSVKGMLLVMISMLATIQMSAQSGAFDWLEGTWEKVQTKPGRTGYEVWNIDSDGNLSGIGCTLSGTDTVFVEHLKIVRQDGDYYYSADVSHNAAPVLFKMTDVGEKRFVCENPEHDFPTKITYSYDGAVLTATISGGSKEIPFRFTKKQ